MRFLMRRVLHGGVLSVAALCMLLSMTIADVVPQHSFGTVSPSAGASSAASGRVNSQMSGGASRHPILIDFTQPHVLADPLPKGFRISNTSLQFGPTELFLVKSVQLTMEWPSPPGTESGLMGLSVKTYTSDASSVSFLGTPNVMNDGVRSSANVIVQFHPQRLPATELPVTADVRSGEDLRGVQRETITILVGSVAKFQLYITGTPIPSLHRVEPSPSPHVVLDPAVSPSWHRPIAVTNPTDQPYVLSSIETTIPGAQLMITDQNDQVDSSRKNWVIAPRATVVLGSLSLSVHADDAVNRRSSSTGFEGFLHIRFRNRVSIAQYVNVSVLPRKSQIVSLGVHTVFIHHKDNNDDASRQQWFSELHRKGEIRHVPIEIENPSSQQVIILDAVLTQVNTLQRGAVTQSEVSRMHLDDDVQRSSATTVLPCISVLPLHGTQLPPRMKRVVASVILNLTACLMTLDHSVGEPSFVSMRKVIANVRVIAATPRDQPALGTWPAFLELSGWVMAGCNIPSLREPTETLFSHGDDHHRLVVSMPDSTAGHFPLSVFSTFPTIGLQQQGKATVLYTHPQNAFSVLLNATSTTASRGGDSFAARWGELIVQRHGWTNGLVPTAQLPVVLSLNVALPIKLRHPTSHQCQQNDDVNTDCLPATLPLSFTATVLFQPFLFSASETETEQTPLGQQGLCKGVDEVALIHPDARDIFCDSRRNPLTAIDLGIHSAASLQSIPRNAALTRRCIALTNPHNTSAAIKDITITPKGRSATANPARRYVLRVAQDFFKTARSIIASRGGPDAKDGATVTLPAGITVPLCVELACDYESCFTDVLESHVLSITGTLQTHAVETMVSSISVRFAVLATAGARFHDVDVFAISRESTGNAVVQSRNEEIVVVQNLTFSAHVSHPYALPDPSCVAIGRRGERLNVRHPSFDILWSAPAINFGGGEGPVQHAPAVVAMVAYAPFRIAPTSLKSVTQRGDHQLSTQEATVSQLDEPDDVVRRAVGIAAVDGALPQEQVHTVERAWTSRRSSSTSRYPWRKGRDGSASQSSSAKQPLSDKDVLQFQSEVAQHEEFDRCWFSFVSIPAGRISDSSLGGVMLTGQRQLSSALTDVVDFGHLMWQAGVTVSSHDFGETRYVRLVNQHSQPLTVEPLLWSQERGRLSDASIQALREAMRDAFTAHRLAAHPNISASHGRTRAASLRIPDDVWDSPSDTFSLSGNASVGPIVIPPSSAVWVGPVTYRPSATAAASVFAEGIVDRIIHRDILLLRMNGSATLDAVMMVGKVGRPSISIGNFSARRSECSEDAAEPLDENVKWDDVLGGLSNGATVPLPPGSAVHPRTSLTEVVWRPEDEEKRCRSRREYQSSSVSGTMSSLVDLWRHWSYAGSSVHVEQLRHHLSSRDVPDPHYAADIEALIMNSTGWLREYMAPEEFESDGSLRAALTSSSSASAPAADALSWLQSSASPVARALMLRLPPFVDHRLQVINKGSFPLHVTAVRFSNGKCQDGELVLLSCFPLADEPVVELVRKSAPPAFDHILQSARWGAVGLSIPPQHALPLRVLRFPSTRPAAAATVLEISHFGGSLRFPLHSMAAVMYNLTTAHRSPLLWLEVALETVGCMVLAIVVGASSVCFLVSARRTTKTVGNELAQETVTAAAEVEPVASPSPPVAPQRVAQTPKAPPSVKRSDGAKVNVPPLQAKKGSSKKVRVVDTAPPSTDITSLHLPTEVPEVPAGHLASTPSSRSSSSAAQPTPDNGGSEPLSRSSSHGQLNAAEQQRLWGVHRQQRHELIDAESTNRAQIITLHLARIGEYLLEWNSSPQVTAFREAQQRLAAAALASSMAKAQPAPCEPAPVSVDDSPRLEAAIRRKQAEKIVLESERRDAQKRDVQKPAIEQTQPASTKASLAGSSQRSHPIKKLVTSKDDSAPTTPPGPIHSPLPLPTSIGFATVEDSPHVPPTAVAQVSPSAVRSPQIAIPRPRSAATSVAVAPNAIGTEDPTADHKLLLSLSLRQRLDLQALERREVPPSFAARVQSVQQEPPPPYEYTTPRVAMAGGPAKQPSPTAGSSPLFPVSIDTPNLLAHRLPSDFTFEDPNPYDTGRMVAATVDYNDFFAPPHVAPADGGASPRLRGSSPLEADVEPGTRQSFGWSLTHPQGASTTSSFNVFGGTW